MARRPLIAISTGCPAGVGPEISVAAAFRLRAVRPVLVGDLGTLREAAELVGVEPKRLVPFDGGRPARDTLQVMQVGPVLSSRDRRPGRPSRRAGRAELAYVEEGYRLVKGSGRGALVTAPVSKHAIATSGDARAARFTGHTEWLRDLDGARHTVMCFAAPHFATSLVTTHLPLARVPRAIDAAGVTRATLALAELLRRLGHGRPRIAVASLNPHAGEGEMFGSEEAKSIAPGVASARRKLGRKAIIEGPLGAETAFRKMKHAAYEGVVAMYHDQATIPMKLQSFGEAVNVTMGLSIARTSVDHGTAYDIAWRGQADARAMIVAIATGNHLAGGRRPR